MPNCGAGGLVSGSSHHDSPGEQGLHLGEEETWAAYR